MRQSEGLTIDVEEHDRSCVLRLDGQMTFAESELFEQQVQRLIARRPKRLAVSLAGVSMITSAGIGALLRLNKRMAEIGAPVILAAARPDIERVLKMSGLDKLLRFEASVDAALKVV